MNIVKFKNYSGVVLHGTEVVTSWPGINTSLHLDRCVLLASKLEAPKWGTVQTYDGCGISGGILHHTATFPGKQELGSLWPLLAEVEKALGKPLLDGIDLHGGVPKFHATGVRLTGNVVRELFTGSPQGLTASPIPEVVAHRIEAVHDALTKDAAKPAQVAAAKAWLVTMTGRLELPAGKSDLPLGTLRVADFASDSHELAMVVTRAFAVNNPAAAKTCFKATGPYYAPGFEERVYKAFAASPKWSNRVANTVTAVAGLGLWSPQAVELLRKHLQK